MRGLWSMIGIATTMLLSVWYGQLTIIELVSESELRADNPHWRIVLLTDATAIDNTREETACVVGSIFNICSRTSWTACSATGFLFAFFETPMFYWNAVKVKRLVIDQSLKSWGWVYADNGKGLSSMQDWTTAVRRVSVLVFNDMCSCVWRRTLAHNKDELVFMIHNVSGKCAAYGFRRVRCWLFDDKLRNQPFGVQNIVSMLKWCCLWPCPYPMHRKTVHWVGTGVWELKVNGCK